MTRRLIHPLILLVILIHLMMPARAGTATGRILGVLKDQKGAVMQAVEVKIQNQEAGFTKTTLTNQEGRYFFDALPAGRYSLTAASPGFEPFTRGDINVDPDQETDVDVVLNVGRTQTVVVVTAAVTTVAPDTIIRERVRTSDSALLLDGAPGLSLYGSGGLSSLPAIHGMADDRVNVQVNGMSLASACSNHMNPPLSYIAPAQVGRISVMAGITPVSNGGDSIGGSIAVDAPSPEFAEPGKGLLTHGSISAYHRSNGVVNGGHVSVFAAAKNFGIGYTGSYVNANDYKNGRGAMIKSTSYETTDHAMRLAARRGNSLMMIDLGVQYVPQQAFVNARMDMTSNRAKFANLHYDAAFSWGRFEARAYYQFTRHEMNILKDKIPGMNMPMEAKGTNLGYSVKAEIVLSQRDTLRVGNELHRFLLDDWWPPVSATVGSMGPDTLWNVRAGKRSRLGTYVEWEARRGREWTTLLGVRNDVVLMNTDPVAGYNMSPTTTGSAAYFADAIEFNSRDRRRLDTNFDVTALARYEPDATSGYEVGYARKTRSPNLYERYLWVKRSNMSVHMNGWFGDANGYSGNLDLQPEVADTFSATAGWHDSGKKTWELRITPYYTHVRNYIDVDRCPVIVNSNGCSAANLTASTGFVNLQFANHAARLYGVDGSGRLPLGGSGRLGTFALSGVLGYVRGENFDTGDNLYHMMPLNASLTLEHRRGHWTNSFDFQAVDAQRDVQAVRNELPTAGYGLANLRTSYQWDLPRFDRWHVRFDAGIDNLFDKNYALPLGGRYWIGDKTGLTPVPGIGRSYYGGFTFTF